MEKVISQVLEEHGILYHAEHVVPYELPANKTRSLFKTLSSPGGGGYSEFKAEEHRTTHADRKSEVKANDHLTVGNNQHIKIGTGQFINVGQEIHLFSGQKWHADAGQFCAVEDTLKSPVLSVERMSYGVVSPLP